MTTTSTFNFNGKSWEWNPYFTVFILEVGRYENKYKIEKKFIPEDCLLPSLPEKAIEYYEKYHVTDGYKKRLSMETDGKRIALAHYHSPRISPKPPLKMREV